MSRRKRMLKDLDQDIRDFVERETQDNIERGMPPDEARYVALRKFGNVTRVKEETREVWSFGWLDRLLQDVRYALRQMRRNPGFAAVAGLTLAFSIGPTTTIFSVVNGVLLAPLPYLHPERLMILTESTPEFTQMGVYYLNFLDWQRQQRSFSDIAGYRQEAFNLATSDGAEAIHALLVSADFFKVMAVSPLLGRAFSAADDHIGAAPTAMLSYGFWQQHFGGARDVVGRSITLSDKNYTVVGVLPRNFWFFQQEDVYVPIGIYDLVWAHQRDVGIGMLVVGRLNAGVTQGQAQADMAGIARRLAQEYPKANAGHRITIIPALGFLVQNVRTTLYLLTGAVCFVLLIACVNIANLLLSRTAAREREVAIRAALGAGWQRVVRQLLTESVLLGLFGGCLGILVASVCTKQLLRYVPEELPRSDSVGVDLRVLLFVVAVSVLTGIVFGLAPALRGARPALNDVLKEGSRGSTGRGHRLQKGLVVVEVGLALVLLAGAGLTLESIARLERVRIGFNPKDALTFVLELPYARYSAGANDRAFNRDLLEQLRALPGVRAAGLAGGMPLGWEIETGFHIEGRAEPQPQTRPVAMLYQTSPGYLQAMGINLIRGRDFTDQDTLGSYPVALIDGALARKFFPHVNPIGRHIILPYATHNIPLDVVGVVDHVEQWGPAGRKNSNIDDAIYLPAAQIPDEAYKAYGPLNATVIVRTNSLPESIIASVKRTVHSIDRAVSVSEFETMNELVQSSFAAQRFTTLLTVIFAAIALALAAIGIYGVISHSVSQRTHEIGIRMALGAQERDVLFAVLRQGTTLTLYGVAIGTPAAVLLTHFMTQLLYGLQPVGPVTFAIVAVGLTAVALLATYIPARRATEADPMVALRYQ